jgi:HTH DNA binding domain
MPRQVSLEVTSENEIQDAAKEFGTKISVVDCQPFSEKGMSLLLELKGEPEAVKRTVSAIRDLETVRQALEGTNWGDTLPLLLVLDRPPVCRAVSDSAVICLDCPLDSVAQPASWRFIVRGNSDFGRVLARLSKDRIQTRIQSVSPMYQKAELTGRQKEIIATAVAKGYFEFPRKISLTSLSTLVGIKPSTLSEILRRAERRIMKNTA